MPAVFNPQVGLFPLTGVTGLPNVTIAYPGEHWSNTIAQGAIVPGEACVPANYGGKLAMKRATATDSPRRMSIATRVIEIPDTANDSGYTTSIGPNEIKNRQIEDGEYVHHYRSGVFHLTLVVPRAWAPSEMVTFNPTGARPTGKVGTGSWDVTTDDTKAWGEVLEFRPFSADGKEGLLTVRSLRTQH